MKILNLERVSLGVILIAAVMVVAGITFYITEDRQNKAISAQTSTTNQLIQQVKDISERNEQLNQENKDYAYCTAQLIAAYTRTQAPITIDDLRTCALTSFPSGSEPKGVTGSTDGTALQEVQLDNGSVIEVPRPTSSTPSSSSTTNNTTTDNSTTNNNPTSPIVETPLLNLGLPCVNAGGLLKTC